MKNFFDKTQYTLDDIQKLIDIKADEGLYLEFKSAEALHPDKKTEITKDISAFANADGGVIIYGLKQDKDGRAEAINYCNSQKFAKDWLQQVIDSKIQQRITDIDIQTIPNPKNSEEQLLIVKIKSSSQAPHMADDKHYYKRTSTGNSRMEEYEVRQMYFRVGQTELDIEIGGTDGGHATVLAQYIGILFSLKFFLKNISNNIEHHYKLEIGILSTLINFNSIGRSLQKNATYRHEDNYDFYTFPGEFPLFQKEYLSFATLPVLLTSSNFDSFLSSKMKVRIYSSSGVKELNYKLVDLLTYKEREIKISDFVK